MNNICLVGQARSGKDTLASFLVRESNYKTYALADPIKEIMAALFSWGYEHTYGNLKEVILTYSITPDSLEKAALTYDRLGLTEYEEFHDCWDKLVDLFEITFNKDGNAYATLSPRKAFQLFGTDWGRAVNDEIWLALAPTEDTIITDIRFDNEATYFHMRKSLVVRITRDSRHSISTVGHSSEAGVSDFLIHLEVPNNDTLSHLKLHVPTILAFAN